MKNNNCCAKCNSTNILRIKGYGQAYGSGDNIMAGVFDQVIVTKYMCCDCGFIEEWLDDLSKVEKIKMYQNKRK